MNAASRTGLDPSLLERMLPSKTLTPRVAAGRQVVERWFTSSSASVRVPAARTARLADRPRKRLTGDSLLH
jgi:hypothetical protein